LVAQACATGWQHGADAVAEFVAERAGLRIDFAPVL
jgi:hypothetical protein